MRFENNRKVKLGIMATKKTVLKNKGHPGLTPARDLLAALGIEAVCQGLIGGRSLTSLARENGVGVATLLDWIESSPERSALAREARTHAARIWDERAEECITMAADPFELAKARELAQHYRWRAKAVAPRDYGDRVTQEITGKGGGAVQIAAVDLKGLSDGELEQMQLLLGKTAGLGV